MEQVTTRTRTVRLIGPERPTWCRLLIAVTLIPPPTGKVLSIERGPRTFRATIALPKAVFWGGLAAVATAHPWFAPLMRWALALAGH